MNVLESKVESLIEEAWDDMRNRNMALQLQGMAPEQLNALQTTTGKLKIAGKQALQAAGLGAAGGALGGGMMGGLPGAALGAATMGTGIGLGSGIGAFANLKSMQNMSPDEIKKWAKDAEKAYGANHAKYMREAGKNL